MTITKTMHFDGQDLERIEKILTRSNDLDRAIGDCDDEYPWSEPHKEIIP